VVDIARAVQLALTAPEEKLRYDVFNVGNTAENYTKKMLVDLLVDLIPGARVKLVHKSEDPRDYRVSFDKIASKLGFETTKTVPLGLAEIIEALRMDIIEAPDDQRYYNIPQKQ
jgi:nucleoside-diphosphate-sugar epimerase